MAIAAILLQIGMSVDPISAQNWGHVQFLRSIAPGETIDGKSVPFAYHGYQIRLEAGTSVECNLGPREVTIGMTIVIPDKEYPVPGDKVPESLDVGRINASWDGLVEPLVIVAEKSGNYVIRIISVGAGKYTFGCGMARPTTDRDRKYEAAQKLFLEIRQAIGDGAKPLTEVADKIFARAEIYRELGDKKSNALSLMDVGLLYSDLGNPDQAVATIRSALDIFKPLNNLSEIHRSLGVLQAMNAEAGKYQDAVEYANQRILAARARGAKDFEADAAFGLGVLYHRMTDEVKAREYYQKSYEYDRSVEPPNYRSLNSQVYYFTNLANLARGMNGGEIPIAGFAPRMEEDFRQALIHLQRSFEVNRKMEALLDRTATLYTFNLLQAANCHKELGEYAEAIAYLDKFDAHPTSKTRGQRARARVAIQYGSVYARMGNLAKAIEYFDETIRLLRAGANPGNHQGYLGTIGDDYYHAGALDRSLDIYREGLEMARSSARPIGVADFLYNIARIERDLGNFNIARKNVEEAIQIAESIRATITADDLRTTYFSTVSRFYDFYIDLLMQAHKAQPEKALDRLAFETSEKARSRNLLDLLTLSGVDFNQGLDTGLLERERTLRFQLSARATRQTRLLMGRHTDAEATKIKQEVSDLSAEYDRVQSEIRAKSPNYAALTQPAAMSSQQIQQLLDSGTVLIEYSLGEKKSYLWVVGPNSVDSFDLPKKSDIELLARKVYKLATARNLQVTGEPVDTRSLRIKNADAEYAVAAASLSDALLGPAAQLIRNKRLLIVPDGALSYISFAALPAPKPTENAGSVLGLAHEIVTLPSASVLGRLRNDTVSRRPASKLLAVFADPVFSQTDTRAKGVAGLRSKKTEPTGFALTRDFERALAGSGLVSEVSSGLPRLPFSRREANSIFDASGKNLSLKYLDFAASKRSVFDSGLDQYRILHFATHSLADSQNPGLSGIVLSLVDKQGADVDGFLRLQDIYNLKLNADLVVLSACSTALGKEVKGEGLIGLTRGFMYAGSPRVVATLWKVDDAATAAFMTIFYRKMLTDNLRPAAALRAAQTEMMKQPRWRSPYYWAPFVLQGEWK